MIFRMLAPAMMVPARLPMNPASHDTSVSAMTTEPAFQHNLRTGCETNKWSKAVTKLVAVQTTQYDVSVLPLEP